MTMKGSFIGLTQNYFAALSRVGCNFLHYLFVIFS
jgi:hypothetical protein